MKNQFGFVSPTPAVASFLIILIASYLIFTLMGRSVLGAQAYNWLVLDPFQVTYSFQAWRIFTYAFLHDPSSPFHLILNALMLYMLGPQLEDRWGEKRFFIFVTAAVLTGGLFVCLSFWLGFSASVVIGFSAATLGLLIAWGLTFSTQQLYIFGILPMTGRLMVFVTVGLELLYAVGSNSVSSAAHIGGMVVGFVFTLGLYKPKRLKQYWRQYQAKKRFRNGS
jgi:membrane associated rhomboid family serine protease